MKLRHKNSGTSRESLPSYGDHLNGLYGWLAVTEDKQTCFFRNDEGEVKCEDASKYYECVE